MTKKVSLKHLSYEFAWDIFVLLGPLNTDTSNSALKPKEKKLS